MGTTKNNIKAVANGTLPERYEYALVCIDGSISFAEGVLRYFVERQRSGESSQPIDFALRALDHHQALRTAAEEYALVYHDDPNMVTAVHRLMSRITQSSFRYMQYSARDVLALMTKYPEPVLVNIALSPEWVKEALTTVKNHPNSPEELLTVAKKVSQMMDEAFEEINKDDLLIFPEEIVEGMLLGRHSGSNTGG